MRRSTGILPRARANRKRIVESGSAVCASKGAGVPEEVWRTFIAIELDRSLRSALAKIQEQFKRQVPPGSVRWVAPEGIHLTLKFLVDTPRTRVTQIEAALQRACVGLSLIHISEPTRLGMISYAV